MNADTKTKWDNLVKLLQTTTAQAKDPTFTYLHGIVFGLDFPRGGVEISSSECDQTVYCAMKYNTAKRQALPLKEVFVPLRKQKGIDMERFQTPDPEQAEIYLRKYCNLIPT